MRTRIGYLTGLINKVNERMEVAKAISDPFGYRDASDEYEHLARERTWLRDLLYFIPMRIEYDTWERVNMGDIQIRLEFAPRTFVTPFNERVYAAGDPRAARMDVLEVGRLGYAFTYTEIAVGNIPARRLAEDITYRYLTAAKLSHLIRAVDFANAMLHYSEQYSHIAAPLSAYPLLYLPHHPSQDAEQAIQKAVDSDAYLRSMMEAAEDFWPVTRRLIAHALRTGQKTIEWKPFN